MADESGSQIKRFTNVPVEALSKSCRVMLGKYLNPPSDNCSEAGYLQDIEGLAELMHYPYQDIQNFKLGSNVTVGVLEDWSSKQGSTVALLWSYIIQLDRHDILTDERLKDKICNDVKAWKHHQELEREQTYGQPVQVHDVSSVAQPSYPNDHHAQPFKNITLGEIKTGKAEYFDAFVCYTSEDFTFVRQMMQMLENVHGLKLCIINRDLNPGTSFYTTVAKLIEDRCKKMIIILSPDYLRSPECDFQTKFAHSLSPGSRSKKLIPVLIKHPCIPPNILRHITPVDYTKCDLVEWFWERLARSLEESSFSTQPEDDMSSVSLGPAAVPMAEGRLNVRPTLPITDRSNITPPSFPMVTVPRTSTASSEMESSMEVSMTHSGSVSSLNSAASSSAQVASMDIEEPGPQAASYQTSMPAPTQKKAKSKKKGLISKLISSKK